MAENRFYRKRKKTALNAFGISFFIHLAVIVILFLLMIKGIIPSPSEFHRESSKEPDTNSVIDYADIKKTDIKGSDTKTDNIGSEVIGIEKFDVNKKVVENINTKISKMSAAEKRAELEKAKRLAGKISEKSLKEIGKFLEIDSTKNQPKKQIDNKKIDYETASLEDIEKIKNKAGEQGYRVTLVDADGNTEKIEVFGKKSKIYDTAYPIFKAVKENPAFGKIYHQLVKPMLPGLSETNKNPGKNPAVHKAE